MKNIYFLLLLFLIFTCENINNMSLVTIEKQFFGETLDGNEIYEYILKNEKGMEVSVINYGGIITSWKAKDRDDNYQDIVLGFDNINDYETKNPYFGALIGRYGNRIAKGKFSIDDKNYTLATNNDENHLHGGLKGFDKVIWNIEEIFHESSASLVLKYISSDMEEGYPGNLNVKVIYTLNNNDELIVKYEADTDKTTIVNLTQHSYFNLSGDFNQDILNHEVKINADSFLPVDSTLIPTGEKREVFDTPFDFLQPKKIGRDIEMDNEQINYGNGYDHCWVLNKHTDELQFVASAYDYSSGRLLEVYSDQPGIQFYTGNFLDGSLKSKYEGNYKFRSGFCFETQNFPNSPNEHSFPSASLRPGEKYLTQTKFKFSVK